MVVIQLGPWGSEMYRSLFAQGIIFFSKITQSNGNSLFLIFKFNNAKDTNYFTKFLQTVDVMSDYW